MLTLLLCITSLKKLYCARIVYEYNYIDDCAINSNPIAASTRVSALNIVADLLKKLDVSAMIIL